MGIGDWGLGPIPNPQSPIPNPQSPIPNMILNFYSKNKLNIIIVKIFFYKKKNKFIKLELFFYLKNFKNKVLNDIVK